MLLPAIASGVLFTLLGDALNRRAPAETRSAGLLTLANTTGAMLGPLVAGFLLLPRVGMEASLRILAAVYGLVALAPWLAGVRPAGRVGRALLALFAASFAFGLALFPVGAMQERHLAAPVRYWARVERAPMEVVGVREGLTETLIYLERRLFGELLYHR